jgi:hypothetical protein
VLAAPVSVSATKPPQTGGRQAKEVDMSGRSITPALAFVAVLAGFAVSGSSKAGVSTRPTSAREYPLTVVAFATEPNRPKAGRLFTAIMGILDEETGEPLDTGDVYCRGRIGSRRVPLVRAQFVEGSGVVGASGRSLHRLAEGASSGVSGSSRTKDR